MTELTLMESSFSCFDHSYFFFFFQTDQGYISAADAQFPTACYVQESRHFGKAPSTVEMGSPMGFFRFFQGFPEVHCHFYPYHLPLTTLESSWAQTPVQEGWAQESQCTVWVLMANTSMCHKAWNILTESKFIGNPPETWTARGYSDAVLSSIRHYMLLPNGWRYWSCYFDLNTVHSSDFACAKHQSKYLFGYILGGSTGSIYTFVSKTVRKIILCKTWDLTA